jgi:transposase
VRQLSDHRDDLVAERKRIQKRLRWNCHDLEIALELPPQVLDRPKWLIRLEAALSALPPSTRRRIALQQVRRCGELTVEIRALERELADMMRELAPDLLEFPGCGALSAASLVGRVAGASRFSGDAAFAMHAGVAPLPVSSGKSNRHRLNRRGDRQLNRTLHMIAITQARMHPPAIAFMARKRAQGMSYREALRCLKRHLARAVFKTMVRAERGAVGRVVTVRFGPVDVGVAV